MKNHQFTKKGHRHTLDDKPLHGVTTILGVIAKPALITWSANMAVKHIEDNFPTPEQVINGFKFSDLFKDAKVAHTKKKESAGNIGTTAHEAIENWIKMGCPTDMSVASFCGGDEQIMKMFMNFVDWSIKEKVEFIASEKLVHSETNWYGGICDFVCIINGKRWVGDIKTSTDIYPEYFLQVAAYDLAMEEMGEPRAYGYVIVNIKKDGRVKVKKDRSTKKYREAFHHALNLYKLLKVIGW